MVMVIRPFLLFFFLRLPSRRGTLEAEPRRRRSRERKREEEEGRLIPVRLLTKSERA